MHNKIIYLHGFNSSPESYKARAMLDHMIKTGDQKSLVIPELSHYPDEAIAQISTVIDSLLSENATAQIGFIGSSLGGYYATWFAEKYDSPAALINPSVRPYESLADYIGENENYHTSEKWQFEQKHIQQLLDIEVECISDPARYLVLLQTGDEVLDYRQAEKKYVGCNLLIEEGGDHSFTGFENHIEKISSFLQL